MSSSVIISLSSPGQPVIPPRYPAQAARTLIPIRGAPAPHLTQIKAAPRGAAYASSCISESPTEDPMTHLARILYTLISTSLAGTFIVVALVVGWDTLNPILIAAALGFVAALPVTFLVNRALTTA
jgi:hypothetical protein